VEDREALVATVGSLSAARTLDVACGTGYLDAAPARLGHRARPERVDGRESRPPHPGRALRGRGRAPAAVADGEFERLFTGHFYGPSGGAARVEFLAEARRVAGELVVADSAVRPDHEAVSGRSAS
jgi:hypothetical protein